MSQKIFIRNLDHIRQKDPRLYEALTDIQNALQPLSQPAPPVISGINVKSANGYFTVTLTDNGPVNAGIAYFLEYSTTPGFQQPVVVHLGPSRTAVLNLGSQTLYWRAYSQYQNPFSNPNSPTVFGGSTPTPVIGGGSVGAPPAVSSTGSGTAATNGQQGGVGFGKIQVRPMAAAI